jgi:hypothetical protein
MAATSCVIVYTGENLTGMSRLIWVPVGERYGSTPYEQFDFEWKWYAETKGTRIQSAQVYPAPIDGSGTACLFIRDPTGVLGTTTLGGSMAQIHRISDTGGVNIKAVNPKVTDSSSGVISVVTINTNRPNRFYVSRSFKALVDQQWPQVRDQILKLDSDLSVHEGPRVSWIWHEQAVKDLQPRRPYARLKVIFNYATRGTWGAFFSDYKITFLFFFEFWAENGGVAGAATAYKWHVSNGKLSKYVGTIADLAGQLTMWEINEGGLPPALTSINQQLQSLNRTATDVFLLPGAQAAPPPGLMTFGNQNLAIDAATDATVVLEVA